MFQDKYDVIVVGAGHAGSEAAAVAAHMGASTLLVTMNLQTIGQMSCNPAMGGIAKGQIVREIDALGGLSGIVSDKSAIQFRCLINPKVPQCGRLEHRMIACALQKSGERTRSDSNAGFLSGNDKRSYR